jgi:uncharacterized OB-fold protein
MSVGMVRRDDASAEFFDATARGELLIRKCGRCGNHLAPRPQRCAHCGSEELTWVRAAGTGRLETWTVACDRSTPPVRTTVGIIELDEGPWLEAQLVDLDPDTLVSDLRFVVDFQAAEGGEAIPVFRRA